MFVFEYVKSTEMPFAKTNIKIGKTWTKRVSVKFSTRNLVNVDKNSEI